MWTFSGYVWCLRSETSCWSASRGNSLSFALHKIVILFFFRLVMLLECQFEKSIGLVFVWYVPRVISIAHNISDCLISECFHTCVCDNRELLLQLLNQIVCELPPEHPLSSVRPLRDSLGHTPLQVCCTTLDCCTSLEIWVCHEISCVWCLWFVDPILHFGPQITHQINTESPI